MATDTARQDRMVPFSLVLVGGELGSRRRGRRSLGRLLASLLDDARGTLRDLRGAFRHLGWYVGWRTRGRAARAASASQDATRPSAEISGDADANSEAR